MGSIRVDNFGGVVQTKDQKKAPFFTAVQASNCDVLNASIEEAYVLDPASEAVIVGFAGRKSIYNIGGSSFLDFAGDVNVVPSPIADKSTKRVYYTGDGPPKATDLLFATYGTLPYPTACFTLGYPIPKDFNNSSPAITIALAVNGGAAPDETRAYVYTTVSPWGEESAPCNPIQTKGHIDGTWRLRFIGALSGNYDNIGLAFGCPSSAIAFGALGNVTFTLATLAHVKQFRPGNLVLIESIGVGTADLYRAAHTVGAINTGAGIVQFRFGAPVPAAGTMWRVGPINSYNMNNAQAGVPSAGKVKVSVDVVQGLRVGDRVNFANVLGMTDLNFVVGMAPYAVESISDTGADTSFVISSPTVQVYTGSGEAYREAPYYNGIGIIVNVTFAAGVATITMDLNLVQGGTAHIAVGDKVLIQGVMGAIEVNGVRSVLAVISGVGFTVALAAMTAYIAGGAVHSPGPHPYLDHAISNVAYAAGAFTFTVNEAHGFAVGDQVIAWDVGGTIEANNSFIVVAVANPLVSVNTGHGAAGAYTAGGRICKVQHQTRKRIYRTNQSLADVADFQLVAEIGNEKCDYDDTIASGALGDVMQTDGWIGPPVDLIGLVAHPNGFLIAYSLAAKALCCSEPYQPHAWPIAYQRAIGPDGVGLEIYGATAILATKEKPFTITGGHPSAISAVRQDIGEACTSKRSITPAGLGVAYRGTTGFFLIGGGNQGGNLTRNYLDPDPFALPSDTPAAYWGNKIVWIDNATLTGYRFEPALEDKALTQFDVDWPVYGLHVSPVDGQLWASYLKNGTQPRRAPLFKITATPARFTYRTQYLYLAKPCPMGYLQIDWTDDLQSAVMKDREAAIVRNLRRRAGRYAGLNDHVMNKVALDGDELETIYSPDTTKSIPTEKYLKATVIAEADKADRATVIFDDFVVNRDPVRMHDGIVSGVYQIVLVGCGKVTAATIASTEDELDAS